MNGAAHVGSIAVPTECAVGHTDIELLIWRVVLCIDGTATVTGRRALNIAGKSRVDEVTTLAGIEGNRAATFACRILQGIAVKEASLGTQ